MSEAFFLSCIPSCVLCSVWLITMTLWPSGFCCPRKCCGHQDGREQPGNGDGPELSAMWKWWPQSDIWEYPEGDGLYPDAHTGLGHELHGRNCLIGCRVLVGLSIYDVTSQVFVMFFVFNGNGSFFLKHQIVLIWKKRAFVCSQNLSWKLLC